MSSMQHLAHRRDGMVYVDDEYDSHPQPPSDSEDSDYEEISDTDSSSSASYHSETDDIAEYWDPYSECRVRVQMRGMEGGIMHCTATRTIH